MRVGLSMSAVSSSAKVEPREEGEELELPTTSSTSPSSPLTTTSPPLSPSTSPTQQKRRRYADETSTTRRDRSDRPDELLLSSSDRRGSDPSSTSPPPTSDPPTMEVDDRTAPPTDSTATAGAAGGAEENKDSTELRLLLESNHVGAIIGKGGEVIKKLREEHQVYINILKVSEQAQGGGNRERVMVLKGSTDTVLRVLAHILELQLESAQLREKREHGEEVALKDAVQVRLLVHRTTVGAVIGKEGSTIRQTSSSTGARVQVSGEALPHSSEKTVAISGTKDQVNAALALVVEQIKSNPPKPGTKVTPYVPGAYGGYPQGGGGGGAGGGQGGYGGGGGYQGQGQQMGGGGGYGGQQQFGTSPPHTASPTHD